MEDYLMQWENLTSLDFEKAVQDCQGVGILSIGVIEAHASHLPLGTDAINCHWVACRAAEIEPAIVFPFYPYGVNIESAHLPGSVFFKQELIFALLENICDEMARNGLNKIILFSGHGGNRFFLPLFVQMLPEKQKPYVAYNASLPYDPEGAKVLESGEYGHACEWETSQMLYIAPDLVKMDQVPPRPFTNLKRNQEMLDVGAYTQVDWYAMYPHMYVGNARVATAEKGKVLVEYKIQAFAELIRAVKADEVTPGLVEEFNSRMKEPKSPDFWKQGE
jgi:creatinine amidohydrolase